MSDSIISKMEQKNKEVKLLTEEEKEQSGSRYFHSSGYLHPYAFAYLRCRVER